ncbi:MAG: Mur ligase family protein, partial [Candidatus Omnitrophica bacterium]|nr:Mur ligase family protein [Candidatus Omnitrophota bacterium]
MRLKDILKGVIASYPKWADSLEISGVTDNSRQVRRGYLFIAVKGHTQDGRCFIKDAIGKGASAIVAEEDFGSFKGVANILVPDSRATMAVIGDNFYHHPSRKLKVIGITGTNGKTTITYILESILKAAGCEPGVIGTINYRWKGNFIPAKNTTPGCLDLQNMLAQMVSQGVKAVVAEVSSHSLDQGRIGKIHFDAAIFTNITSDHLDYHKTTLRYFQAKKKIFNHL